MLNFRNICNIGIYVILECYLEKRRLIFYSIVEQKNIYAIFIGI